MRKAVEALQRRTTKQAETRINDDGAVRTSPPRRPGFEPIEGLGEGGGAPQKPRGGGAEDNGDGFEPRRTLDHARTVSMLAPGDVLGEVVIEGLHARGDLRVYAGTNRVLGDASRSRSC